jgi:hypothetical protein
MPQNKAPQATPEEVPSTPIPKPSPNPLERFKSRGPATIGGVETLLAALPHHKLSEARDFVRLHPNEQEYWSSELCFVNVPIVGQKKDTLHLIYADLAQAYLPGGKIQRFRLALAAKPYDVFFLAHIPTTNTDNTWVISNLRGCEQAKTRWTQLISRKAEGQEQYQVDNSKDLDAFPEPRWPTQSLDTLIITAFSPDRLIDHENHPGLLRLIGAKQKLG